SCGVATFSSPRRAAAMLIIFRRSIVFDSPRPCSIALTLSLPTRSMRMLAAVVAHRNHELSQVAIGDSCDTWSKTSHDPAIFDQVLGIERVDVIQLALPFSSRLSFLILTI